MKQVTHGELQQLLKKCYEAKLPLFIWGAPGIGKSTAVKDAAKKIAASSGTKFSETEIENGKFGFVDVRLSQLDSSDLRGIPVIRDDTTKWALPSFLPRNSIGSGILFLDELNLAPPLVQNAAYQLILDRKLGDYRLPDGWLIICAGNRLEDSRSIFEMSAPLANRMAHTELKIPSIEEWTEWALTNGIDSRIVAFLNMNISMLYAYDSKTKEKTFPTPRSWAFCSKLIKNVSKIDELELLVPSVVGSATGNFVGFLKLSAKLDVNRILANPKSVEEILEPSLKFILLSLVSDEFRKVPKNGEKCLAVCKHMQAEFGCLLLRFMKAADGTSWNKLMMSTKIGDELLDKYKSYFTDAGD